MNPFFLKVKRIAHQTNSVVNGIVGDKLQKTALGIGMNCYDNEQVLVFGNFSCRVIYRGN
jgi:hypothetical protein